MEHPSPELERAEKNRLVRTIAISMAGIGLLFVLGELGHCLHEFGIKLRELLRDLFVIGARNKGIDEYQGEGHQHSPQGRRIMLRPFGHARVHLNVEGQKIDGTPHGRNSAERTNATM